MYHITITLLYAKVSPDRRRAMRGVEVSAIEYRIIRWNYLHWSGHHEIHSEVAEMAKTVVLEWGAFMGGKVVEKDLVEKRLKIANTALKVAAITAVGVVMINSVAALLPAVHAAYAVHGVTVPAMAAAGPDFSAATKPIKDIIFGAAHEIYFIFMSWGALEALIGKAQQGFTRMKVATGAYILLYWVPWIVDAVNKVRPAISY